MLRRLSRLRPRLRQDHGLALVGVLLLVYFGYHAVHGSRGLLAWRQYDRELAATQHELARLRAERTALERKVVRLRYESLDPDLLDEAARRTLALVGPRDVLVLLGPPGGAREPDDGRPVW